MVAQLDGRNYALYGKVWEDVDPEISHWVSPIIGSTVLNPKFVKVT